MGFSPILVQLITTIQCFHGPVSRYWTTEWVSSYLKNASAVTEDRVSRTRRTCIRPAIRRCVTPGRAEPCPWPGGDRRRNSTLPTGLLLAPFLTDAAGDVRRGPGAHSAGRCSRSIKCCPVSRNATRRSCCRWTVRDKPCSRFGSSLLFQEERPLRVGAASANHQALRATSDLTLYGEATSPAATLIPAFVGSVVVIVL